MNKDDWISKFFEEEPASPAQSPKKNPDDTSKTLTLGDVELEERIAALRKTHDEIEKNIEDIFKQTGTSPKSISSYLDDPKNFSPEQWSMVQRMREDFEKKILKVVGPKFKKQVRAKRSEKGTKERKGKTIGGRKKWMPMR